MVDLDMYHSSKAMSHISIDKTTTIKHTLHYAGKLDKSGEVHKGGATKDWMEQEKERGINIASAAATCSWRDHWINVINILGRLGHHFHPDGCQGWQPIIPPPQRMCLV